MSAQRKVFRIEQIGQATDTPQIKDIGAQARHAEMMSAIKAMQETITKQVKAAIANPDAPSAPASALSEAESTAREMIELYKKELNEARRMKRELDAISIAISRTKQEIATLHFSQQEGGSMHRMTDELDAVVFGTEHATQTILESAEIIDGQASNLVAKLKGDDQGMAADIQEQIVHIFEACNFQDLTGQRINKVVKVLRFIEDRVDQMMDIWGGLESFADVQPSLEIAREGDAALLNGPALPEDEDRATQDMIDALFA
jgi:chemotaxis protein CheZ